MGNNGYRSDRPCTRCRVAPRLPKKGWCRDCFNAYRRGVRAHKRAGLPAPRRGTTRLTPEARLVSAVKRFWTKVEPEPNSGCWLWTAYINRGGYGCFFPGGDREVTGFDEAHRWAYEHFVGSIPFGMDLDHLCRVRSCVNPRHLEPVTRRENIWRSPITCATKTHCPKGHPYDENNTVFCVVKRRGKPYRARRCRTCIDDYDKMRRPSRNRAA